MKNDLVPNHEEPTRGLSWSQKEGAAAPADVMLRSPASNAPCVHWRLRIIEALPSNVLVHDVAADEPFEIECLTDPTLPPERLRIDGRRACIDALATLHPHGSAGAQAVAQAFGLSGAVSVEEILIRPGARIQVEGVMVQADAASPFRAARPEGALEHVTVRVPGPLRRTGLLPWAFGTGAALLGLLGAAGAVLRRFDAAPSAQALINFVVPAEVSQPRPTHVRWP